MSIVTDAQQDRLDRQMERELHAAEFLRHHPEYAAPAVLAAPATAPEAVAREHTPNSPPGAAALHLVAARGPVAAPASSVSVIERIIQ
jgi:hypothetical protein